MDECVAKFKSLFFTDSPPFPLPPLSEGMLLVDELSHLVEPNGIVEFVSTYPKDKACGIDSIHVVLLHALSGTSFFSRLSGLFARCVQSGQTPGRWNQSVMYLLPKSTEPPVTCDSVRPLSILPMFRRIFEALISPLFTDPERSYCKLHPAQAGFRKGYSTMTQAAIYHHALSTKAVRYAVFLDFKSAYDVTSCQHVMASLRRRGMPVLLLHLIRSLMFSNGFFRLVVNGSLSDSLPRDCGLPQGSSLSPVIFDIFIDPLLYELNGTFVRSIPRCLFFADDGLLLCESSSEVLNQLAIADRWARQNGMVYNVTKCGIISMFPTVGRKPFYLSNRPIPFVDSYKYLGFPVTKDGIDFARHIDAQIESTSSFLKFVQVQCSEWSPYARYVIYTSFIRPKLEYGAPLTVSFESKELLKPIQKIQDQVIAWIFNTNVNKVKVLYGILGALSVEDRFSHLRCGFQLHLDHSSLSNPIRSLSIFQVDVLYRDFVTTIQGVLPYPQLKLAMAEFLLSRRSGILDRSKSVLVKYITSDCRTERLIDRVLLSPIQYQRTLLSWRRGSLFLNQICICKERWHRGHIPCLPKGTLSIELREEFVRCKEKQSKNFCEVDFLLNVQEWSVAFEWIQLWKRTLDSVKKKEN